MSSSWTHRRFHVEGRGAGWPAGLVESQRSVRAEKGAYEIGLTRRAGLGKEPLKVRPRGIAGDTQLVAEPLEGFAVQHRHGHPRLGGRESKRLLDVPGGGEGEAVRIGNEETGGRVAGAKRTLRLATGVTRILSAARPDGRSERHHATGADAVASAGGDGLGDQRPQPIRILGASAEQLAVVHAQAISRTEDLCRRPIREHDTPRRVNEDDTVRQPIECGSRAVDDCLSVGQPAVQLHGSVEVRHQRAEKRRLLPVERLSGVAPVDGQDETTSRSASMVPTIQRTTS